MPCMCPLLVVVALGVEPEVALLLSYLVVVVLEVRVVVCVLEIIDQLITAATYTQIEDVRASDDANHCSNGYSLFQEKDESDSQSCDQDK